MVNKGKGEMTDGQIIQKAIEKAKKNGWKTIVAFDLIMPYTNQTEFYSIIFDKDFAKAFWNYEVDVCSNCGITLDSPGYSCKYHDIGYKTLKCWQYHLQIMVIKDNPVKYLSQFL